VTSESSFQVLQEDPTPYFLAGDEVGVLLLHGFSGTPREMRPLADYLHAQGLTVYAPLLHCHGGTLAQMNRCRWQDWIQSAASAHARLAQDCEQVVVGGFSMGSLLALWLAEHRSDIVGLALYSPALRVADWRLVFAPLLRYVVRSIDKPPSSDLYNPGAEAWLAGFRRYPVPAAAELLGLLRHVRRQLHRVQVPAFVVYALDDRSIHPQSGPETVRRLAQQAPVETLVLRASGHAVVVDREWARVAVATHEFVTRVALG
jgi:carboxylesterase